MREGQGRLCEPEEAGRRRDGEVGGGGGTPRTGSSTAERRDGTGRDGAGRGRMGRRGLGSGQSDPTLSELATSPAARRRRLLSVPARLPAGPWPDRNRPAEKGEGGLCG